MITRFAALFTIKAMSYQPAPPKTLTGFPAQTDVQDVSAHAFAAANDAEMRNSERVAPFAGRLLQNGVAWLGLSMILGMTSALIAFPSLARATLPSAAAPFQTALQTELSERAATARQFWASQHATQSNIIDAAAVALISQADQAVATIRR